MHLARFKNESERYLSKRGRGGERSERWFSLCPQNFIGFPKDLYKFGVHNSFVAKTVEYMRIFIVIDSLWIQR